MACPVQSSEGYTTSSPGSVRDSGDGRCVGALCLYNSSCVLVRVIRADLWKVVRLPQSYCAAAAWNGIIRKAEGVWIAVKKPPSLPEYYPGPFYPLVVHVGSFGATQSPSRWIGGPL